MWQTILGTILIVVGLWVPPTSMRGELRIWPPLAICMGLGLLVARLLALVTS